MGIARRSGSRRRPPFVRCDRVRVVHDTMPGILHGRSIPVIAALWTFTLVLLVRGTRTEGSGFIDWARLWVLFTRINPYFFSAMGIAAARTKRGRCVVGDLHYGQQLARRRGAHAAHHEQKLDQCHFL